MIGFFQENENQNSITRVNTSLLIWAGIFIALITTIVPLFGTAVDTVQNFTFSMSLIGTGLAGKLIQKPMEEKKTSA